MKALFTLLLLAGLGVGGFYGYQYLEKAGKLPWQTSGKGEEGDRVPAGAPEGAKKGTEGEKAVTAAPKEETPQEDEIAAMYPVPEFQTLEQITDNWTKIPARAFPRPVIIKYAVKMEIGPGAVSTIPSGKEMLALGMEEGLMVVTLDAQSTARAKVSPKATTIVDQIAERYEIFKKEQKDRVMAQRESEKKRRAEAKTAVASSGTPGTPTVSVVQTKAPSADPRFAPMVESIKGGASKEIEMKNIMSWRWGGKTQEGGQEYDYGLITYSVDTLFGTMDTEAMALIKNGKVQKWVYTGSGDEVP